MPEPRQESINPDITLFPHQERVVQRLMQNNGSVVMAHGVGSGKTISSLAGVDRLRKAGRAGNVLVAVPAGLKKNYADSVKNFSTFSVQVVSPKGDKEGTQYTEIDPGKTFTVVSYDMFRRDPEGLMQKTGADTLIFDEYHKVRDPGGATYRAGMKASAYAKNFMGLTGSIVNNDPVEVVPLINLAARQQVMSPAEFNSRYKRRYARARGFFGGKQYLTTMTNTQDLKKRLGGYVDYINSDETGGDKMPRRKVEEINVEMSKEQKQLYEFTLKKVNPLIAYKIRHNLPVDQKEAFHIFSMIQQARQAANSIAPFSKGVSLEQAAERTPKVKRLLDDTVTHLDTTPDGQVVLYSNLIKGGVDVLDAGLTARGIPHAVFVGKGREVGNARVTADTRNAGVEEFKSGKKKVIVLSGAGAEGLDLKNSTMFQSLDGHFNPEKTRQAEARARRLGGQAHRPPEKREVQVRRYFSTYPKPGVLGRLFGKETPTTTDQWVHSVAQRKYDLNQKLLSAFQQPKAPVPPTSAPATPAAAPRPAPAVVAVTKPQPVNPVPSRQVPTQQAPTQQAPVAVPRGHKYLWKWKDREGDDRYKYVKTSGAVLQTGITGRATIADIEKDVQSRGAAKDPKLEIPGLKKKPLGSSNGFKAYLVDGEWVRNNLSVIFGSGGHGLVHEFIPMNEIWLSDRYASATGEPVPQTRERLQSTLLHEIHEHLRMRKGLPYWHAHESARKAERLARE